MSNKIKELAKEAGLIPGIMGLKRFTYFDPEKFAELIIAECCVTADANIDDTKYPSYWIKRKFRVE
jgi:hypothetical protein